MLLLWSKNGLPASGMLATTRYFSNTCIFRVLAVFTTVVAVSFSHAVTSAVRAFVIVCHTLPLLFDPYLFVWGLNAMLEPRAQVGQALQGTARTTTVRRRSPNVSTSGLSN
jgi:ABC-type arginine/histidine transport system permease subunit